ncbi:hypothetical protein [Hymenobacter psychrotolerans]|uniref:Uncharacterized protein n=1 Tax=Hymenobacter psychrotolerans DSM 18569 TaxID=1121959 RepID=A0A1M6Y0L2_9BACT|nr:hypothetical protein [Hymenobacter psychrotolerans]SHL11811.1 hypothetical protein SAMN02746009_02150 [Hymenobacter psychrotolerans DSM 18569]
MEKRKEFLKVYLGALGAVNIVWGESCSDRIFGTVLYDREDKEEQQDFVWYMTEAEVPSQEVVRLIQYIIQHQLLDVDKLCRPLTEIAAEALEPGKREKAIQALLDVEVRMMDDGQETDSYFIHE